MSDHQPDCTREKLFGSNLEEQLMMEEILEILAEDSSNHCSDAGVGTDSNDDNDHTNDGSTTNNEGNWRANNEDEDRDRPRRQDSEDCPMDGDDRELSRAGRDSPDHASTASTMYPQYYDEEEAELEEKLPAVQLQEEEQRKQGQEQEQEQEQEADPGTAVGHARQQLPSMDRSSLMSLAHVPAPMTVNPTAQSDPFPTVPPFQYFPSPRHRVTPPPIPPTTARSPPPLHPSARVAIPSHVPSGLPPTSATPSQVAAAAPPPPVAAAPAIVAPTATVSTLHVLPTGQQVHVMNGAEFDEIRRKVRSQMESRRYRKRKKEEAKQQKQQLQQLQTELARLRDLEAQTLQYQQRSVASLEAELAVREQEIAQLSAQLHAAALEELDWVNKIRKHLGK